MGVETTIRMNKFVPREYQLPIMDAIVNKGYKRVLAILPRRAGKDITAFNLCIRQCLKKPCVIYYIFPTYAQAKKVIWDTITNEGKRFVDYIPPEVLKNTNSSELKFNFINGSILQLVGSDNFDALMGTNPQAVVFSEYALQDPRAYQYLRPILTANDGWALFLSTPRGKNHLWDLYQIASHSPHWFCYKLSLDDTNHVSLKNIQKEKEEEKMSDDLIQQEYYCSFEMGVEGAYYTKYLDRMRVNGHIGQVPWESSFKVHTAWDLGVRDSTAIIFFQVIGQTVRIIDYYERSKEGLEHYVRVIESKPYSYGRHIAPHDIRVTEFGSGLTRIEKARQLGIKFTVADDISVVDGIEAVRSALSKIWIDEVKCSDLIKALENYRQEYDIKRKIYNSQPLHNWASHACFIGETNILTRSGMRPIMSIKKNDEVLTLSGWKKCLTDAKLTIKNANLVEVSFKDGMKVKCTPDHLFLTDNGWKSSKNLMNNTEIQSYLMNWRSILMDIFIVYGHLKDISQKEEQRCIGLCGVMLLELYQVIATFITKIEIPSITISGIWNVCPKKNIYECLDQIIKDLEKKQEKRLPNGMLQMLEDCGIKDMLLDLLHGLNGKESLENASIVAMNINALLEKMVKNKNFATIIAKPLIIENVKYLKETDDVWDITVEDEHHFSLENGAIVHNSDCMRYLCISLPKTRDGLSPEELDRRYNEAIYGHQSNLPSVFRDDLPPY